MKMANYPLPQNPEFLRQPCSKKKMLDIFAQFGLFQQYLTLPCWICYEMLNSLLHNPDR